MGIKVIIKDSFDDTEILCRGNSLEEIVEENNILMEHSAYELAKNEVEDDWELYYNSWKEAFEATYEGILDQLKSEKTYHVLE